MFPSLRLGPWDTFVADREVEMASEHIPVDCAPEEIESLHVSGDAGLRAILTLQAAISLQYDGPVDRTTPQIASWRSVGSNLVEMNAACQAPDGPRLVRVFALVS